MFQSNTVLKKLGAVVVAAGFVFSSAGCGTGSASNVKIDGVTGPNVSFVNGMFLMTASFKNVQADVGIRVPLPHMPNSYVELGPDFQSSGLMLSVALATADITFLQNNIQLLQPNTLPGGRPLPGISAGQLPSLAVQVPALDNMTFYIGTQVLGAFVPVKFGATNVVGTFRFFDSTNAPIGTLSIVGSDTAGKNSGFLLLIDLTGKVGSMLK